MAAQMDVLPTPPLPAAAMIVVSCNGSASLSFFIYLKYFIIVVGMLQQNIPQLLEICCKLNKRLL
jgi:hypothetical protein